MEQGTNHGWKTKGNFILLGTFLALVLALMVIAVVHAHKSETLEHSQTTAGTSSTTTAPTTVPATPATVQTTLPTETEVTTAPTEITTLPTETEPTTVPTEPPETTEPTEPKPTYSSAGYGEYLNVGTTYIAEVITTSAETFNGKPPTITPLPSGISCRRAPWTTLSPKPSPTRWQITSCCAAAAGFIWKRTIPPAPKRQRW